MENLPQNELTLQDIPFMLRRRWLIISALGIIGALGGGLKGLTTGKTFKADVMIQLENRQRSNNASSAEISQLADAFSISNTADAEIEIVKSRLVLGNVVRDRKLNIAVWPKRSLLDRLLRKPTPGLELESFQVGPNLIGHPLELRVLDTAGLYSLRLKDSSSELLRGRIKQTIDSSSNKYKISLLITSVWNAKPGQIFNLVYNDDMAAIQSLEKSISVEELGRKTGLLALSYSCGNPNEAAEIVNSIADNYVNQNIDRIAHEADQRHRYLQRQIPELKARADSAANKLRQYRTSVGSVNLDREVELAITTQSELNRQRLDLNQKKTEALERFRTDHPSIRYIDSSITVLNRQASQLESKMRTLPFQQQEMLDLIRDVQTSTDRYTKVLSEAQQLQVVSDQKIGDVRIVDRALVGSMSARKGTVSMAILGLCLGVVMGSVLTIAMKVIFDVVESPKLLEAAFGVPVTSIIPHCDAQTKLAELVKKAAKGSHLLAIEAPDDLAMESLRASVTPVKNALRLAESKLLLIASLSPGDGKSFVSTNLSAQLALAGSKVLLIDADLRRGNLHGVFGLRSDLGLSNNLADGTPVDSIIMDTRIPNLFLIPSGSYTNKSTTLLQSDGFAQLIASVSERFDFIVVDAPPLLALSDAMEIAGLAGTIALVFKYGAHTIPEIEAGYDKLTTVKSKICGIVFNDVPLGAPINGLPLNKRIYKYSKL